MDIDVSFGEDSLEYCMKELSEAQELASSCFEGGTIFVENVAMRSCCGGTKLTDVSIRMGSNTQSELSSIFTNLSKVLKSEAKAYD